MNYYDQISRAVVEGDADETVRLIKEAVALKYPPDFVLEKGLVAGINSIAESFRKQRVIVPEVLMSTRAMHAGLTIVKGYLKTSFSKNKIKIIIGTVAGDLHDIGKNLVKIMSSVTGVEVIDLGVDVTAKRFVREVREHKPNFLLMSSLLTTTMYNMKDVIDDLTATGLRDKVKIIVGGAPIDEAFSKEIGADYYFRNAFEFKDFLQENITKLGKNGPGNKSEVN